MASLAAGSCQNTIDDEMPESAKLVVDGWIDSGGHPVVILTRSFSPMNPEATTLADLVVRWAEVKISDGDREEVMIGRMDRSVTPPFVYTTPDMIGEPGKKYTIAASYDNLTISAQCSMPKTVEIDKIEVLPIEDSDDLYEIKVSFTPEPGGHYQLCISDPLVSGRPLPCFMGTYRASEEVTGPITLNASRPKVETVEDDYTPYYPLGSHIKVMLTAITPEVWKFWNQYDDLVAFGGNVFLAGTIRLPGNIENGYGIWNARAVSSAEVEISELTVGYE